MQIKDYTPLTTPPSELDKFLVETSEGTRVVPYGVLKEDGKEYFDLVSWKRQTYRGKRFTTGLSTEQVNGIKNGTFDDLFLGDVFTYGGTSWVIADFNYFWGRKTYISTNYTVGDADLYEKPHLHIVSEGSLETVPYSSSSTTNGFANSRLDMADYDPDVDLAYAKAETIFQKSGLSIQNFLEITSNGLSDTGYTGFILKAKRFRPLNSMMVFGENSVTTAYSMISNVYKEHFMHNRQLSLFKIHNESQLSRKPEDANPIDYWLSDIANTTKACIVTNTGRAQDFLVSNNAGYRPFFILM